MGLDFQSDILIILPKPHEYEAFKSVFPEAEEIEDPILGPYEQELRVPIVFGNNNKVTVRAVCIEAQGEMARNPFDSLIQRYMPKFVILLGTAGGATINTDKKLAVGSVIFSDEIFPLTEHRLNPETKRRELINRGGFGRQTPDPFKRDAKRFCDNEKNRREWLSNLRIVENEPLGDNSSETKGGEDSKAKDPDLYCKSIASGPEWADPDSLSKIQDLCNVDTIAYDMESYLLSTHQLIYENNIKWIVIRGVSDNGEKGNHKRQRQIATISASIAMKLFIKSELPTLFNTEIIQSPPKQVINRLTPLIEVLGLTENEAWTYSFFLENNGIAFPEDIIKSLEGVPKFGKAEIQKHLENLKSKRLITELAGEIFTVEDSNFAISESLRTIIGKVKREIDMASQKISDLSTKIEIVSEMIRTEFTDGDGAIARTGLFYKFLGNEDLVDRTFLELIKSAKREAIYICVRHLSPIKNSDEISSYKNLFINNKLNVFILLTGQDNPYEEGTKRLKDLLFAEDDCSLEGKFLAGRENFRYVVVGDTVCFVGNTKANGMIIRDRDLASWFETNFKRDWTNARELKFN